MHVFLVTNQDERASYLYSIWGIRESPEEQKGTMLVIFIYEVVVNVYLHIACALKALQKNNGIFTFDGW